MAPQPYFPEPITVPNNVAEAKHRVRVRFVRKVVAGYFVSSALVAVSASASVPDLPPFLAALVFFGGLVALSAQRRAFTYGMKDNLLSVALLLPTLFCLGQVLRSLHESGWAVLALAPVVLGVSLYALLCGNDFSYMGQFVLTGLFTVACVGAMEIVGLYSPAQAWTGLVLASAYLFFLVYDLSMLVKRRRLGEEVASVADLYRDLLNFVTYLGRVYWHWRKFRFP